MPGKLKAKIVAGRHLPVMDRASDLTDAFVEVKFGNTTFKTDVYPKSLNPQWNSEWFKFEVDDEDLQDEPLQITVLDHDTYSANDAIGKVYIDIDPLLCSEAATVISGWLPIYDTIHGIRGEINVLVKVDLFNDLNRFRQSSCGVKFFCTTSIPRCYRAIMVHGFVEELVVNEDPEYQWIDRIRTPRASNEARQRLLFLMSGELQRKIGLKVLEMGGNAVVGYLQCFDLEGESGLVVRAIGTACTLEKISTFPATATYPSNSSPSKDMKDSPQAAPSTLGCRSTHSSPVHSASSRLSQGFSVSVPTLLFAGMGSGGSAGKEAGPLKALLRQQTQSALEQRGVSSSSEAFVRTGEYPFFTLTAFPPGFLLHVGGVVSARSVKLLDRIHNPALGNTRSYKLLDWNSFTADEPETRDAWWEEIRQEIKSHAKALGCHAVVGYSESTSICEEVCILSASGTAAILGSRFMQDGPLDAEHRLSRQPLCVFSTGSERVEGDMGSSASLGFEEVVSPGCGFCHIPYDELNIPFPAQLTYCYCCRHYKVPDVLFTTIDLPTEANVTGKGCLIQARLCRTKKKAQGEGNATAISNLLPFLEYELHTQLMNKLKLRGMNALFGLRIQISVGETMLLGLASATGVYLTALPLVAVTAVAMSFDKEQTLENGKQSGEKTLIKAITDEQLQFNLELNAETSSPNPLSSPKGLSEVGSHPSARASSVDYSSFADRCSSWIEQLKLKAHTIRRGSVKTTSSMEKASPLPEGRSRSLRSNRSYSGSSVAVVKMTPLSFIPGAKIIKYLGIINMFFIRETTSLREEGGVSGFLHTFIAEVFAMVRAHVAALGGNAVVSYSMKECVFMENPNKNQAQCLINVSGDAVIFVRESELELTSVQPQSATTQTSNGGEGT
ncbi:C2 domain-containing protein 5-like [Sinocyclocheilus rhinocerous]|uniref:C2 domain-containing protein 5-like n=1 Tax=Sinocyclocheilus rhinocerous TaxID=307959 RepID=UPI0007B95872|nr:PREDICTED: C2 domain-containing protein 5-like [Sinocyclocheilus rhinocerous]